MHPASPSTAYFDHRLRRVAVLLHAVAIGSVWLYANLPLHFPAVDARVLNLITLPALGSLIAVWRFPWRRFHRNLFLAVTGSALTLIALAVAVSDGWHSPLILVYPLVVLFNAAYYPRWLAFLLDCLVVLASLAPALYQPGVAPLVVHLVLFGPVCLCTGFVADLLMHEVRRREREVGTLVAQREQRTRELTRLAALHRTSIAVTAELDARRVMEAVVHELAVSLGYRFVGVYLHDGAMHCLRAQVGYAVPLERIGPDEGVIGRVFRTGRGALVADGRADPDYLHVGSEVRSEVCVPILRDRIAVGVVNVESVDRLDHGDLEVLELFAQQIGAALANAGAHAAMAEMARRDALTGVLGRRALLATIEDHIGAARRVGGSVAVLFIDVDGFKAHNDRHGHACGDEMLRACTRAMGAVLAPGDALGRYGGDEFLAVLPGADHERGLLVAEAIRARIAASPGAAAVTVSIGVACVPEHAVTLADLLQAADSALYEAKAQGRDRVCVPGDAGNGKRHAEGG